MHNAYQDIRSRISESPTWWDENAVPRYDPFATDQIADIYADECALVLIECQNCGAKFRVAFSASQYRAWVDNGMGGAASFEAAKDTIANGVRDGSLHYGDPPNADCCAAGPTMNCEDLRVLEYWRRNDARDWERVAELEIVLPDHPEYQEPAG